MLRDSLTVTWLRLRFLKHAARITVDQSGPCIDFSYRDVRSIRPLKGCRINHLNLYGTEVNDWQILRLVEFKELNVGATSFGDASLLRGKHITRLEMLNTPVTSLEAVADAPISLLQIGGTNVHDMEPIKRMPLEVLLMLNSPVSDLTFLRGMNLREFAFTFPTTTHGIESLFAMPNLKRIATTAWDSFTVEDFRRRYETGLPLDENARFYSSMETRRFTQ